MNDAIIERLCFGKGHGGITFGGKGQWLTASKGKGKAKGKGGQEQGMQCGCCGKANHTKATCVHSWKTCTQCGRVGHLQQACTSPTRSLKASAPCTRCKSTLHVSKDCPHSAKECSSCGKVGHLRAACTSTNGTAKTAAPAGASEGKATYDQAVDPEDQFAWKCLKAGCRGRDFNSTSTKCCKGCGQKRPKEAASEDAEEVVPEHLKSKGIDDMAERLLSTNEDMNDEPAAYVCPKKQEEAAEARTKLNEKIAILSKYPVECAAQIKAAKEELARLPRLNRAQPLKDAAEIAILRSSHTEAYMKKKQDWKEELERLVEEENEEVRIGENELREAQERYRLHKEGIQRDHGLRAKMFKDKQERKTEMLEQLEEEHKKKLSLLDQMALKAGASHANVEHQEQQQKPQQQQGQQQGQPQQQESTIEQMMDGIRQLSKEGTPDEQLQRAVIYMFKAMSQGQAKSTSTEQQGEATPGEQNALVLALIPSKEVRKVRESSPGKGREKSRSPRGERAGEF